MEKILPNTKKKYSFNPFIQWNLKVIVCFAFLFNLVPILAQKGVNNTSSQQKLFVIKGIVKDKKGDPIVGATVILTNRYPLKAGSSTILRGTTTNFEGVFTVKGSLNDFILIAYIGFEDYHQKITQKTHIYKITLKEKTNKINEIVVTGIVNKRKESFTGASQTYTGKDLKALGNSNILQSLKMMDPSFIIKENNKFGSNPNKLPEIEIRGRTSIPKAAIKDNFGKNPNQPLFILDGFEISLQRVMDLDMNRVSSVTILKDASSTALYGAQAANGVVVIETIKSVKGKLQIRYNYDFQMENPDLNDYNLMNAREKLTFEKLAGRWNNYQTIDNIDEKAALDKKYNDILANIERGVNTYWLSEPLHTGFSVRHSIYIGRGVDSFTYGIGLNYRNRDGVMKGSSRNTWGTNIDFTYRKNKINVSNRLYIDGFDSNESPYGNFSTFARTNPYYKKRNENGEITRYLDTKPLVVGMTSSYQNAILITNPLYDASLPFFDKSKNLTIENRLNLVWFLTRNIQFTSGLFVLAKSEKKEKFLSRENSRFLETKSDERGFYTNTRTDNFQYNFNAMITYRNIFKKHVLTGSLRGEQEEKQNKLYQTQVVGFPSGSNGNPQFAKGYKDSGRPITNLSLYRRLKLLTTINYSYDNTYLFDATYTIDGSTTFGTERRFSPFWNIGLGWNLHRQFHMNPQKVQVLKLRGNIGDLGNQNFGSLNSSGLYNFYPFINHFGQSAHLTSLGNPNLKWQKTRQISVGIDAYLFNGRLNATINAYQKKTNPLVVSIQTKRATGISEYPVNLGFLKNEGLEFNLNYYLIYNQQKRIYLRLGIIGRSEKSRYGGFSNRLDFINNQERKEKMNPSLIRFIDGNSPDDLWAVPSLGIDPATGEEVFLTKDGKPTTSFDLKNERVMGNSRPTIEGVFSPSFQYKNFTIGANIRYRFGADRFNRDLYNKVENLNVSNISYNQDRRALYNRWKKPGDISKFKNINLRLIQGVVSNISSRFIQRENIIVGESINLSCQITNKLLMDKLGLTLLKFTLYANDIFRLSSIKVERGLYYPFARSVSFSINASF